MILGALLGLMIAVFVPDYYRTVLRLANDSPAGIIGVGIVLGATQGLVTGIGVGIAIIAIYAWYLTRRRKIVNDS